MLVPISALLADIYLRYFFVASGEVFKHSVMKKIYIF